MADIAVSLLDPLVGPDGGLHRGTQADSHVHAQEARIYAFQIIVLHGVLSVYFISAAILSAYSRMSIPLVKLRQVPEG